MFKPGQQLQQVTTKTGEFGEPVYTFDDGTEVSAAQLQEMGYSFDASGNPIAPTQTTSERGPLNMPFGPMLRKRFLGDDSQPIFGKLTDADKKRRFQFWWKRRSYGTSCSVWFSN